MHQLDVGGEWAGLQNVVHENPAPGLVLYQDFDATKRLDQPIGMLLRRLVCSLELCESPTELPR
jgi:hypothetical protein